MVLFEGIAIHLNSLSARAQFLVALLFGYTVYTSISAVLVAELAVSDYPLPFQSIDDVVDKGYSMCVRTESFLYAQLEVSRTVTNQAAQEFAFQEKINKSTAWARYLNGPNCPKSSDSIAVKESICQKNAVFFESRAVMTKRLLEPGWKCGILIFGGNKYFRKANSLIFFKGFRQKRVVAWL